MLKIQALINFILAGRAPLPRGFAGEYRPQRWPHRRGDPQPSGFTRNTEEGVTLLLAILVLSTVLAISFSIAAVLLVEVRNSGDLARTEPAIYAAQGVTEESFFEQRRNVPAGTFQLTSSLNSVDTQASTTKLTEPIFFDKVSILSTDIQGSRNRYPLYDVNQPYGGLDPVSGVPVGAGGYGRIQVTHVDTGSGVALHVYVCQFDPGASTVDCASPASPNMVYRNILLGEGQATPVLDLDPSLQQEIVIYGDGTNDSFVQITAFGPSPFPPKGIPYFGRTAVEVTATTTTITRKLRIQVPDR